jgi:hypothetical protein
MIQIIKSRGINWKESFPECTGKPGLIQLALKVGEK